MTPDWYRTAFGAHYPVLYAHRDEAEAARCLDTLGRLAPFGPAGGGRILDLGCGDGRHLARLAAEPHRAVGLDLSPELLALARKRDRSAPLVRGDMRRLPFQPAAFTAVLSLFTAFGYFSSDDENLKSIKEISRVLVPGGRWFLDYLDSDGVRAELAAGPDRPRTREAGPLLATEERALGDGARRVEKTIRLLPRPGREAEAAALGVARAGLAYRESVALYSLAALDDLARRRGLGRVASAGGYDGRALGEGDRWILVYEKEGAGGARA